MRFGRHFQEEGETIQMAPLIDIVFLTLVFFMMTSVYTTLESEIDITLPTADAAEQQERSRGTIYINLEEDGRIILNGRDMTMPELQQVLYRVAAYFPGGAIIVRGDAKARLEHAIAILNCCKKADIQNVAFAALPEEPEGAP